MLCLVCWLLIDFPIIFLSCLDFSLLLFCLLLLPSLSSLLLLSLYVCLFAEMFCFTLLCLVLFLVICTTNPEYIYHVYLYYGLCSQSIPDACEHLFATW